jgi:hypothetical protein
MGTRHGGTGGERGQGGGTARGAVRAFAPGETKRSRTQLGSLSKKELKSGQASGDPAAHCTVLSASYISKVEHEIFLYVFTEQKNKVARPISTLGHLAASDVPRVRNLRYWPDAGDHEPPYRDFTQFSRPEIFQQLQNLSSGPLFRNVQCRHRMP